MKKIVFIIVMLSALSLRAATNLYLNISDAELVRRIDVIPTLESSVSNLTALAATTTNVAYSAGPADVWFGSTVISASFTNTAYAAVDLSSYVGTNVSRVTVQFKGLASTTVSLRTYGDTNTVDDTSMNGVVIASGATANMSVNTDSSGRIDVKATANTSMTLVAFISRHVFQ